MLQEHAPDVLTASAELARERANRVRGRLEQQSNGTSYHGIRQMNRRQPTLGKVEGLRLPQDDHDLGTVRQVPTTMVTRQGWYAPRSQGRLRVTPR